MPIWAARSACCPMIELEVDAAYEVKFELGHPDDSEPAMA